MTEHLQGVQALQLRATEAEQRAADAEDWATVGREELARLQSAQQKAADEGSPELIAVHVSFSIIALGVSNDVFGSLSMPQLLYITGHR